MALPEEINIPQKPPMVMVGRLIEAGAGQTTTSFTVSEDNIFCENGEFREAGLIENMAQTAAAGICSKAADQTGEPPVGFIGGIRNLKIIALPKAGQEIVTRITMMHQVFDSSIVRGEIFIGNQLLASCELKIFLVKQVND